MKAFKHYNSAIWQLLLYLKILLGVLQLLFTLITGARTLLFSHRKKM